MAKFYRVIKDHPLWVTGAIVSKQDGAWYRLVNDIFIKDLGDLDFSSYSEGRELVENQPEWFERVYEVSVLGRVKYLIKSDALKAYEGLYKVK